MPQQGADLASHRTRLVDPETGEGKGAPFLLKEVVVHVQQCEGPLGDELRIVGWELGKVIVQIETPDVNVGLVGVWTQGALGGGGIVACPLLWRLCN